MWRGLELAKELDYILENIACSPYVYIHNTIFNPWRACAARVTVVCSVAVCVCLSSTVAGKGCCDIAVFVTGVMGLMVCSASRCSNEVTLIMLS